jgi:hypothetical protein
MIKSPSRNSPDENEAQDQYQPNNDQVLHCKDHRTAHDDDDQPSREKNQRERSPDMSSISRLLDVADIDEREEQQGKRKQQSPDHESEPGTAVPVVGLDGESTTLVLGT